MIDMTMWLLYAFALGIMTLAILGNFIKLYSDNLNLMEVTLVVACMVSWFALLDKVF